MDSSDGNTFTGEMSHRCTKLSTLRPALYLNMNPADAKADGLEEKDKVSVTSPHGSVQLVLNIDASIQRGYLFARIHYSKPNLNVLMRAVPIDPKARMPALKVVPVEVKKHNQAFEQIIPDHLFGGGLR